METTRASTHEAHLQVAAASRLRELRSPIVQDDRPAHDHGVAAERHRLVGRHGDELRDAGGQHGATVFVERAGVVDRFAVGERAEACIQMIVPGVDQFEREHLHAEPVAQPQLAARVGPRAIPGEEHVAAEEGIARSLEVLARR